MAILNPVAGVLCLLAFVAPLSLAADPASSVATRTAAGRTEIVFESGGGTSVLHTTAATVKELKLLDQQGVDVRAVSWSESADSRRWITVDRHRDGRWSRPQQLGFDIALRNDRTPHDLAARPLGRLFVVQFETMSLAPLRDRLRELGLELLQPIPEHAQLVRMDPDLEDRVRAEPFVRRVERYHPAYRLEAGLLEAAEGLPLRCVLQTPLAGSAEKQLLAAEIDALGGTVVRLTPNGYLVEALLDPGQLRELAHSDHLLWAEAWTPIEDDMDNARIDGGADLVEAAGGYDGTGVRGEVMDGGLMIAHPDHDGYLLHGGAVSEFSHGTATYGIVFGNGDRDGDGEAQATGMLPGAKGYFASYFNFTDRYQHTQELVSPPIDAVFQSNSWGNGRTLYYTSISSQLDDIIWMHDIAIFQSQSNAGDQYSRPQAWSKNVVSIGGVAHFDTLDPSDDVWGSTASIGPASDGRIKPDLSHWNDWTYTTDLEPGGYVEGSLYTNFGGTSGATPIAAGLAGLVFQMWADNVLGNNPSGSDVFERRPHASTTKALLVNSAEQYPFTGESADLTRVHQGWGRPSAGAFYSNAPLTKVIDESAVLADVEFHSYEANVAVDQPELKVTMVYTDRAAVPSAAIHRVNDLTLRVTSPSGVVYWGNHGLLAGNWSSPGGEPDTINTIENVFVQSPESGDWIIDVFADEIAMEQHVETPEPDSDYALVVHGAGTLDECRSGVAVPSGLTATPAGDNAVDLAWSGSAASFEVLRALAGCDGEFESVAIVSGTSYTDIGVSGGTSYGYKVRGVEACSSLASPCTAIDPAGPCTLDPTFAGVESVAGMPGATCGIEIDWSAATARCGGSVRYNLYRSISAGVPPSAANRIALCLDQTTYQDTDELVDGQSYSYVVRAEDPEADGAGPCGGAEESNSVERHIRPDVLVRWDFESGLEGWTTGDGVPPAATGDFVVGNPVGTSNAATPAQPEDDVTPDGTQALYTAPNPVGNLFLSDVDDGEVIAVSPVFDPTPFGAVGIELWRWHYNRDPGEDPGDYLHVELSNGNSTKIIDEVDFLESANQWTRVFSPQLGLFLTETLTITVRSADGGPITNVIESAIDDIRIVRLDECASGAGSPGAATGLRLGWSAADLRLTWNPDCGVSAGFGIYRGELGSGLSSLAPLAAQCDVAATFAELPADSGDYFFLVAPNDGVAEGSLGSDSSGSPRPQPASVCYARAISLDTCAP